MLRLTFVEWNMKFFVQTFVLCCSYKFRRYSMHVSIIVVGACRMEDPFVQRASYLLSFENL